MGTCPSSLQPLDQSHPAASVLFAAGAKNVGDTIAIGCGSAGTVSSHVGCPTGFQAVGETGSCHYCSGNNGTASTSSAGAYSKGGVPIIGKRLNCKLVQYLGNGDDCCRTGSSSAGSCDPTYTNYSTGSCDGSMQSWCPNNITASTCQNFINQRNGTSAVNNIMQNYCSQGDRIFTDPVCTAWAGSAANGGNNSAAADAMRQSYCAKNLTASVCLDYCTAANGTNTGQKNWCDTQWIAYAATNPTDPLCSCLLPLNDTNFPNYSNYLKLNQSDGRTPDPRCFSADCVQKGYKLGSNANCPQCVQSQLVSVGSNVTNTQLNNIIQSCNTTAASNTATNASVTTPTTTTTPTPTPTTTSTPTSTTTPTSNTNVVMTYLTNWKVDLIALACCCLCFILLVVIVMLSTHN